MRIGIIGTGRIAGRFILECGTVPEIEITAVYNPHEGSAENFVRKYMTDHRGKDETASVSKIEDLWQKVDAVYIASPHETHFGYIREALSKGKHVLCEKPMTLSKKEAEEAFLIAEENGLVLMEAIKTAWCPGYKKLIETAKCGVIGDIRYVDACFTKLENPEHRELTDRAYGGSFTELGSYVMLPVADLLGTDAADMRFEGLKDDDTGLDLFTRLELRYPEAMAALTCGLGVKAEGRLLIAGTEGNIVAEAPWWKVGFFTVNFEDPNLTQTYDVPFEGDGLRYELKEFLNRAEKGQSRSTKSEKERSIFMADMMERFLKERAA